MKIGTIDPFAPIERGITAVDLHRVLLSTERSIPANRRDLLVDFEAFVADRLGVMVLELHASVWETTPEVVEIRTPATWWDHAKEAMHQSGGILRWIAVRLPLPKYTVKRIAVSAMLSKLAAVPREQLHRKVAFFEDSARVANFSR